MCPGPKNIWKSLRAKTDSRVIISKAHLLCKFNLFLGKSRAYPRKKRTIDNFFRLCYIVAIGTSRCLTPPGPGRRQPNIGTGGSARSGPFALRAGTPAGRTSVNPWRTRRRVDIAPPRPRSRGTGHWASVLPGKAGWRAGYGIFYFFAGPKVQAGRLARRAAG